MCTSIEILLQGFDEHSNRRLPPVKDEVFLIRSGELATLQRREKANQQ